MPGAHYWKQATIDGVDAVVCPACNTRICRKRRRERR
jgi:hypothetical protein